MKKYLMTGIAALALSATFVSCSHDVETYTQEEINQFKAQEIVQNYEQAFIKNFGQPASNQDWGFGSSSKARTRAYVDVNGNQWKEIPTVKTGENGDIDEVTLVFNHVNKDKSQVVGAMTELPKNIQNYWVTQVYTGTDKYNTWQNRNNTDDNQKILGSSKMNNLRIAMDGDASINADGTLNGNWTHINNFNAASNTNYGGNTFINDGGTFDFAYENSDDSNYHNKWIAVRGSDINPDLAGYYYICFDFIGVPDNTTTYFKVPVGNHEERIAVTGVWESAQSLINAGITNVTYNNIEYTVDATWTHDGMDNPNMCIPANNVYTDWIIRLVEAEPDTTTPTVYQGRVMAEDLSVENKSDFDFNDVVFDWKIDGNVATIQLRAAGGTLPLTVGGEEVHSKFGVSQGTMVNTGVSSANIPLPYTYVFPSDVEATADNIPIVVTKNGVPVTLSAVKGKVASKINVPITTDWVDEYVDIQDAYSGFGAWVNGGDEPWGSANSTYVDHDLDNNN